MAVACVPFLHVLSMSYTERITAAALSPRRAHARNVISPPWARANRACAQRRQRTTRPPTCHSIGPCSESAVLSTSGSHNVRRTTLAWEKYYELDTHRHTKAQVRLRELWGILAIWIRTKCVRVVRFRREAVCAIRGKGLPVSTTTFWSHERGACPIFLRNL